MKSAVQQMMLGSICTNEEKTLDILKKIKKAGYDGIELNSYMIHPTSFFVRTLTKLSGMPSGNCGKYDWLKLCKEADLEVVSLHSDLNSLEKNYDNVIEGAKKFNTNKIVITGMYNYPYQNYDDVILLANRLNEVGKKLREDGFNLLYHNHNIELVKHDDKSVLEIIMENTNEEYLNFEMDTYWLSEAGANPFLWMKKLGKRIKLWHIADRGIRLNKTSITPIVKYDSVELNYGNIDLDSLFELAKELNIEYVVLEIHKNWINNSPLESIILSSKYLNDACASD